MILLVGEMKDIEDIRISLEKYFEDNGYSERVELLDTSNLSQIEVVAKSTELRPDMMFNIQYDDSSDNMHKNIFVGITHNASTESKVLQEEVLKNLKTFIQKEHTYVFSNTHCSNYIIRLKPYPTIHIRVDREIVNPDIIAKSLYRSVIAKYTIPKLNQTRIHKCAANLNMKTTPDKSGELIVTVPKGTKCMVLEQTNNIYWKIRVNLNGKYYVGYCAQTYIRLA